MIASTTLDNGLRVVTEHVEGARSVALSFWVGTGSRDELAGEAGMSHFLEHLLFKGSDTRSALDIALQIDAVGGDMNAFTTKESTAFYIRTLADDLDIGLDILCDIMCSPAFDPTEVEAERDVVLEEILMRGDEPADLAQDHLSETMFAGHPLGCEILGSEDGIRHMQIADIRQFFEHHYRPKNLVFAAAGAVDHAAMVHAVAERWHGRDGGAAPERVAPSPHVGCRFVNRRPTDQAHLVLGVPAPSRYSNDRYAVSLLDVVLGGGMSSRLFQEVREKRGLAYTVYSSYAPYHDAGEFTVYLGTAPHRVEEALNVVGEELQRIRTHGVTAEELLRAKSHLRAVTLLGLEDTTARMSRIGRSMLFHGDVLSIDEVLRRFEVTTADDVGAAAETLFSVDPNVAAVGQVKEELLEKVGVG